MRVRAKLAASREKVARSGARGALEAPELRRTEHDLEMLEALIQSAAYESICGASDDSLDVEAYDGSLGVSVDFVRRAQSPVGQLQWLPDLVEHSGEGVLAGNVSGRRWTTGALISDDLFLTAGHSFDRFGGGWSRPSRNGEVLEPAELATLMRVNFNYQKIGRTEELRPEEVFPVAGMLEYREGGIDFAIVRLGPNTRGVLPGRAFGALRVGSSDPEAGEMLCIIQHPNGLPKRVEAGPLVSSDGELLAYDDIDTMGGASGSPILDPSGSIVGIHAQGGCSSFNGHNSGIAITAAIRSSAILRDLLSRPKAPVLPSTKEPGAPGPAPAPRPPMPEDGDLAELRLLGTRIRALLDGFFL